MKHSSGTRTEQRAELNGLGQDPPHGGLANGEMTGTYDSATQALDWEVKYARLSGAMRGMEFSHPIDDVHVAGGNSGTNALTGVEATQITSGRVYIEITTARYPDGEVRGRVVQDASLARPGTIGLRARLSGRGEEIPNAGTGKGEFTGTFDPATRTLD
jgi:hypothetical protein